MEEGGKLTEVEKRLCGDGGRVIKKTKLMDFEGDG